MLAVVVVRYTVLSNSCKVGDGMVLGGWQTKSCKHLDSIGVSIFGWLNRAVWLWLSNYEYEMAEKMIYIVIYMSSFDVNVSDKTYLP